MEVTNYKLKKIITAYWALLLEWDSMDKSNSEKYYLMRKLDGMLFVIKTMGITEIQMQKHNPRR